MHNKVLRVLPLLFSSGLCALIYQTAWQRELRLIFGSSTFATAAVLAIFMGGLGLGGAVLGKRADAHPSPLKLYGNLELLVAGTTALSPLLVELARTAYGWSGGSGRLGTVGATALRLLLSSLVLAAPTFAMGGTLPAAARVVESEGDQGRGSLAWLYSLNTMGAVTGALLSTFFLLEVYGTRTTLWLACLLNAVIGLVARVLADRSSRPSIAPPAAEPSPAPVVFAVAPKAFVLAAAGGVGFVFFLMELVWYRMLGPLLGGSTFTFGLILAVALFGIALGGGVYALFFRDRAPTSSAFAWTCLWEAACVILPFALGDRVAILTTYLRDLKGFGFPGLVSSWAMVTAVVTLPAAFVSGFQFPLLIALLGKGNQQVGRNVGEAYAWNTVGSILGSLAGGFGMLPGLGALWTWRVSALVLAGIGVAALALSLWRARQWMRSVIPLGLATLVVWLSCSIGPTAAWRYSGIGAGRLKGELGAPNALEEWRRRYRTYLVWEAEGLESSVAINGIDGLSMIVNGKSDGNAVVDGPTQVMGGLLGAALRPDVQDSLVIGLGTGSTAGWLAALPQMKHVEVIEIEPAIVEVARQCAPVNQHVMDNPKVHLTLGDAREALTTSSHRYDVIFSEPSNPYRAGVSSLFTREFYQAVKRGLAPDGLFIQWVQAYEVDSEAIRSVMATLGAEFGHVEVWQAHQSDLLLVASREAHTYDVAALRARIEKGPLHEALVATWQVSDVEGFLSYFVANDGLVRQVLASDALAVNTDDQNTVEFAFARDVGQSGGFDWRQLSEVARRSGQDRPLVSGAVDWNRVKYDRFVVLGDTAVSSSVDPKVLERWQWIAQYRTGRTGEALRLWRQNKPEPLNIADTLALAEVLAEDKDQLALHYADRLRPLRSIDAEVITAKLSFAQGAIPSAVEHLEAAFVAHRSQPWMNRDLFLSGLELAPRLAMVNEQFAQRLFVALYEPFSVRDAEGIRRSILVKLAKTPALRSRCAEITRLLEPDFPWTREMLEWRYGCLLALHGSGREHAGAELTRFLSSEPVSFADTFFEAGVDAPANSKASSRP